MYSSDFLQITGKQSAYEANRELLSRITKKKDWFKVFVGVLHDLEKSKLIKDLTGGTYEEFIGNRISGLFFNLQLINQLLFQGKSVFDPHPDQKHLKPCARCCTGPSAKSESSPRHLAWAIYNTAVYPPLQSGKLCPYEGTIWALIPISATSWFPTTRNDDSAASVIPNNKKKRPYIYCDWSFNALILGFSYYQLWHAFWHVQRP